MHHNNHNTFITLNVPLAIHKASIGLIYPLLFTANNSEDHTDDNTVQMIIQMLFLKIHLI